MVIKDRGGRTAFDKYRKRPCSFFFSHLPGVRVKFLVGEARNLALIDSQHTTSFFAGKNGYEDKLADRLFSPVFVCERGQLLIIPSLHHL